MLVVKSSDDVDFLTNLSHIHSLGQVRVMECEKSAKSSAIGLYGPMCTKTEGGVVKCRGITHVTVHISIGEAVLGIIIFIVVTLIDNA